MCRDRACAHRRHASVRPIQQARKQSGLRLFDDAQQSRHRAHDTKDVENYHASVPVSPLNGPTMSGVTQPP